MPTSALDEVIKALHSCLCAQIEADGHGVCACIIAVGEAVLADYASSDECGVCGMGWVRLTESYPSVQLGAANQQPGNCEVMLGADFEIGIMRCSPVGDEEGNPPDPSEWAALSEFVAADIDTMRRAILCCNNSLDNTDIMLGQYTPVGPQGGLVGGVWTLAVQVP